MGNRLRHRFARLVKSPAVLALLVVVLLAGCATRQSSSVTITLGQTVVPIQVYQCGRPQPTMINVHDDENTSVLAGKAVVAKSGGRIIELAHSGRRHVAFELQGKTYQFDPNRIFSDAGIQATLNRQGYYSEAAHEAVKRFAAELVKHFGLDREPAIVALHNTASGGLSINRYQPNRDLNTAAARVHSSAQRSPGDFFYVTDARFFDYLKARDFNVTLQDNATVTDDGSMSVYFGRKGIPYINIEADDNHLEQQTEMVRVVRVMLSDLGLAPRPASIR